MNPNSPRPGHLFFTPRTPWGTRAGQQSFRQHQRASEDGRELPEEEEDGHINGKIEFSGETHGKPETTIDVGYKTNSIQRETARHTDPVGEGREKLNRERQAAREKQAREAARLGAQKEADKYANAALSAIDDTAAYFNVEKRQAQPGR